MTLPRAYQPTLEVRQLKEPAVSYRWNTGVMGWSPIRSVDMCIECSVFV